MKKVYVTGHTGFVGSNLTKRLEQEYQVITSNIDLRCNDLVNDFIKTTKPDWVFHCAAIVGGIAMNIKEPYKFLYENLQIQNNVINSCLQNKVDKILFLGSSCIYPKDYRQPLVEEDLLMAPVEPTNEGYAIAKIAGLKLCEYANRIQDVSKFICLMPCNLYGVKDHFNLESSHVLASLVKKIVDAHDNGIDTIEIWGSGKPKREWLYVEDLVDCMIWSMNNINKMEKFLNVGTGQDISIIDLAYLIAKLVGYKGNFVFNTTKPDGMMKKCLDVSKINNLGWKAKVNLEEGLIRTITYYRELKK